MPAGFFIQSVLGTSSCTFGRIGKSHDFIAPSGVPHVIRDDIKAKIDFQFRARLHHPRRFFDRNRFVGHSVLVHSQPSQNAFEIPDAVDVVT